MRMEVANMQKRLNISIDEEVIEKMDSFAKKKGLSRSALLTVSVNEYLNAQEKLPEYLAQLDELKKLIDDAKLNATK